MPDFYSILTGELRNDPLGVGYANMTDDEVAASLNEPRFRVPTTRFITCGWKSLDSTRRSMTITFLWLGK